MADYWCGAYFVICATLSVFGNCTTIFIILLRKSLRTVSNCLIGHLALVDLVIGGPVVIPNAVSAFGGDWVGGSLWCKIHSYLSLLTNMIAYILLTFIALDAFILIHFPFRYRGTMTIKKANVIVFTTWLLLGSFCAPMVALNDCLYAFFLYTSIIDLVPNQMNDFLIISQYVYRGALFLIMMICYATIVRTTQKHLKTCRSYSFPKNKSSVDQSPQLQNEISGSRSKKGTASHTRRTMPNKYATKAAGTMFIILVVFLGAWLPTSMLDIVYQICVHYGIELYPSLKMLLILNNLHYLPSAINPILYAARQQHIRYEFVEKTSGVLGPFFRQKGRGEHWGSTSTKTQQINQLVPKLNPDQDASNQGSIKLG